MRIKPALSYLPGSHLTFDGRRCDSLGYALRLYESNLCGQCTPFMLKGAQTYAFRTGAPLSRPFIITAISAIAFSIWGGALLDRSIAHYPIMPVMALSGLVLAYLVNALRVRKSRIGIPGILGKISVSFGKTAFLAICWVHGCYSD